jgi:serine/threonine-protein kinase
LRNGKSRRQQVDERLVLDHEWIVGKRIGGGGFGEVFEVSGEAGEAVAKLVPNDPGADRELLFVDLGGARNVVPILESGEHDGHLVLVMPRAAKSLHDLLEATGGGIKLDEVLRILRDVCNALVDLDGKVVHRDLKPQNILLLNDQWCLADFGISRYAEATTAPDTQKYALSPPYAAPERWRMERATSATDIYALGVIAYEMIAGQRPFEGRSPSSPSILK